MFNQVLSLIYHLFRHRGGRSVSWIEHYLGTDDTPAPSFDDLKNEPGAYETMFSEEHRPGLERLYVELLREMTGRPYQECSDAIDALDFLQEISATAMWKYHQKVGATIEEFVRDFDRLDVASERLRLYEQAQRG